MSKLTKSPDGKMRCRWCEGVPEFIPYHDKEWGFPVSDDIRLFEKISLEGFQSGLSWRTILLRRENFRKAFANFDFHKVSKFTKRDVERLLKDEGIIRHRGKIEAVINNAKRAIELIEEEGSLASYIWKFEAAPKQSRKAQMVSTSEESIALSKALKKKGWKFIGPTTIYAFMQAMGLINDHVEGCMVHKEATKKRKAFKRP